MVVEALSRERKTSQIRRLLDGLRTKFNDMLDDSRIFRRRSSEDMSEGRTGSGGGGVNIPASAIVGLLMYLLVSAAGGIWWAATMQTKQENQAQTISQLWQKVETQEILINKLENGLDERVRNKAREVLTDWGYIHVPRREDKN